MEYKDQAKLTCITKEFQIILQQKQDMQQLSRRCTLADHNSRIIEYVCAFSDCKLSRFICSNCILDEIHKHDQLLNNNYILDQKKLCDKIINDIVQTKAKQLKKQYNQESTDHLKMIIQEIQIMLKKINNIILEMEQGKIFTDNVQYLEHHLQNYRNQELERIISLHSCQYELNIYQQLKIYLDSIIQNTQYIDEWRFQLIDNKEMQQYLKDTKYEITLIDDLSCSDNDCYSGAISNDLKYIASGYYDRQLKIWDDNYKLIKSIKLDSPIFSCKFTNDSKLLYVGSYGNLYQFNIKKLEQLKHIKDGGYNISWVLDQQFLMVVNRRSVKLLQITGELIREFEHYVENFFYFNIIQNQSLKAILILGRKQLNVCRYQQPW